MIFIVYRFSLFGNSHRTFQYELRHSVTKYLLKYNSKLLRYKYLGYTDPVTEDSPPDSISDTPNWLCLNDDLDSANDCEDNCVADFESDIERENCIDDPENPEHRDSSASPNVPGSIWPPQTSKRQAGKMLVTVNRLESSRNKGIKKKQASMRKWVSPASFCSLTEGCIQRYIMGEWRAVAWNYQYINRCIAGATSILPRYVNLMVWVRTVQEYYWARFGHIAESQSGRKTTHKWKTLWKQLLIADAVEWTIY